jgi:chemotaxis protein CheX
MTRVVSDELERLAPEAVTEVFASYGLALTRVPLGESRMTVIPPLSVAAASSGEATVAGFIGFAAPAVRGAVLLASTFNVIARARPPEARKKVLSASSSSDWILVRDWAGELVNQVLGRVKNRMRAVGLKFDVSAPAALSGQALNFAKPKSELTRPMLFEAHPDRVWFWLDAQWSSEVEPVAAPGRQRKEGDVILF